MSQFAAENSVMKMNESLISVIIPVHNGEAYLEKCIESIATQDYEELEILVINDGSTDATAEICSRLCMQYENLRVITLTDLGVSVSRNRGLEQARGAYVMFVDADDRLRPGVLKGLYNILLETDSDMAGCGFAVWLSEISLPSPKNWTRSKKNLMSQPAPLLPLPNDQSISASMRCSPTAKSHRQLHPPLRPAKAGLPKEISDDMEWEYWLLSLFFWLLVLRHWYGGGSGTGP